MHHLIYLSQATRPLSAKALTYLLDQARQANERQHLTGALIYRNKRFIQLLEGEQAVLEQAYARITRDPRHQHLCKVADYPVAARRFAEWPLAFQSLSPAQFTHLAGYLAPTPVRQRLPGYGFVATLFVDALRALVQPPAVYEEQAA
ncbi:MAG: BLUF domain-containing protein [Hymenobacter sp.]|nr:MAG: BLUF domain-containing protein [Hymenobacter sp.]